MQDAAIVIRKETPHDQEAIFSIVAAAFERDDEARLVDALRGAGAALVSLVAETNGQVVGHVLVSPVTTPDAVAPGLVGGIAPLSVLPEHQRQGLGNRLMRAALEHCQLQGMVACVLLGHPAYYPRFGFLPGHTFGLRCVYDSPPEAFMAMELSAGALAAPLGLVLYHPAFDGF